MFGFIAVQNATAQAPNPHPAHEALKGLQPFIGNWAGEFEPTGFLKDWRKGVVELKATGLHFDLEENTINKTNSKLQTTRRKPNRKTLIIHHKNLVLNGKKIGDLKEIKMTRVPNKKKAAGN